MFSKDTVLSLIILIVVEFCVLLLLPAAPKIENNAKIDAFNQATITLQSSPSYDHLLSWQEKGREAKILSEELDTLSSLSFYSQNFASLQAAFPEIKPLLLTSINEQQLVIAPTRVVSEVKYLPQGQELVLQTAETGQANYKVVRLAESLEPLVMPTIVVKESRAEIVASGTQTSEEAQAIITQLLHPETNNASILGLNAEISNVKPQFYQLSPIEFVTARSLQRKDNCSQNIDLIYNLETSKYRNSINIDLSAFNCHQKSTNFVNCTDCEYAPLGKTTRLSFDYVPQLVPVSIPGGGQVTAETNSALLEMYQAAKAQNIYFYVRSAYRSFDNQKQLFNGRKQNFIRSGYSDTQADLETNRTIAYSYYSEHHLGTTVDLNCQVCQGSSGSKGNNILFNFLKNNAANYGFVISYPQDQVSLTGYNYEPWHLRYIGRDLSSEFQTRRQAQVLSLEQFLQEKSLYY